MSRPKSVTWPSQLSYQAKKKKSDHQTKATSLKFVLFTKNLVTRPSQLSYQAKNQIWTEPRNQWLGCVNSDMKPKIRFTYFTLTENICVLFLFLFFGKLFMNLAKKRKNMEFEEKNKKCNFHSSFGMLFRIISLYFTYINILIKKSFIFLFFFFQVQLNSIIWLKNC